MADLIVGQIRSKVFGQILNFLHQFYQSGFDRNQRFNEHASIFSNRLSLFYPKIHLPRKSRAFDQSNQRLRSQFLSHFIQSLLLDSLDRGDFFNALMTLQSIRDHGGDCTCVVVEGLTWGGAGKTQVILSLLSNWQDLQSKGSDLSLQRPFQLSILCHGYGKSLMEPKVFKIKALIQSNTTHFQTVDDLSLALGDEFACLFVQAAKRYQDIKDLEITLLVGGSWQAKQEKARILGSDLMICDGGGWRKHLDRDLNVILIDCQQKWRLLPFGFFKSVMHFTPRQHIYLFNHSAYYRDKDQMSDWLRLKNPDLCYAWIDYQFIGYRLGYEDELLDLNLLKNKKICLLTAVAMAQRLKIALESFGLAIEQTLTFRDHFDFREDETLIQRLTDLNSNSNSNSNANANANANVNDSLIYLTTFKDRVKLKDTFKIYYLEIKIISTR